MDLFQIPDDYKPQKPLTAQQSDQITNYLKGHPLFLKELPQDISQNQHLVALQALIDTDDRDREAQILNKQANTRLKQGPNSPYYLKDAYKKYTQAINLDCHDPQLKAKLHSNRASINLKFKNYGKVIQDCKIAIEADPLYLKAYYRMAKAYLALGKNQECVKLLQGQADNQLIQLHKQALGLIEKDKNAKKIQNQLIANYDNKIENYFKNRKWRLGKHNQQLPEGVRIEFIQQKISIPIIVVYPEFGQFDLIARTDQNQKISQCLEQLFESALPWDAKRQYTWPRVQLLGQIEEGVLLRIPRQATISELACRMCVRGALQVMVVVGQSSFASHFKSQYKVY